MQAALVGIAVSVGSRQARYIPLAHHALDAGPQPDRRDVVAALKDVFEDPAIEKVGHDLKREVMALARYGVTLRGLAFDTMLASYLLDATRSAHPLEEVALEHIGYKALTEEDVRGRGAKALGLEDLPPAAVLDFAGERVDLALAAGRAPGSGPGRRAARRRLSRPRAAARPGARRDRAGRHQGRLRRCSAACPSAWSASWRARTAKIFDLAGEVVQHQLSAAARARSCSTG